MEAAFPHLAGCFPGLDFSDREELRARWSASAAEAAVLCAAPHGAAAPLLDELLTEAERAGTAVRVVDISADFRFADGDGLRRRSTATPTARRGGSPQFRCALPEHLAETPAGHVGHPGCFVTATCSPRCRC